MSTAAKIRQRRRLFDAQGGLCHWCTKPMVLPDGDRFQPDKRLPRMACTLDHLDDRLSDERGKHPGEARHVAACKGCNNRRSTEAMIAAGPEKLRAYEARRRRLPASQSPSPTPGASDL